MKKKQRKNQKNTAKFTGTTSAEAKPSIRLETLKMAESMAYDMTLEMLAEQYKEGGYLAFVQAMAGFVQRYDMIVSDAESLGQDERMCRAVGAGDISVTFIPQMRIELAKLEAH
jgi:hypothetical protein